MSGGMSAKTGRMISEDEHIWQSVRDILTTPIVTRIERREYGSIIPELIDQPGTPANRMRLMSASIMAIIRWEPRLSIQKATIDLDAAGNVGIDMDAVRRSGPRVGTPITLSIPLR